MDSSSLSIETQEGSKNFKIQALNEERLELNEADFRQIGEFGNDERILLTNCSNNFDYEGQQLVVDVSIMSNNAFRVEKIRVKNGKFNKNDVQELVDVSKIVNVHMSDYGGEQNIRLPQGNSRLYCDLHTFFNINTYMTDAEDGYFEIRGGRFNAALSFEELSNRFPAEMEDFLSVFRDNDSLEAFWRAFNFNMRHGKFQRLNEFCAERMGNDENAEAVWHFTSLMMTLQVKYLASFQNLNSQQLIDILTIVFIRLENFSFVNVMTRPLHRLKFSIRETITILRENPQLAGTDALWMSSLSVLEILDWQLTRERVRTVAGVLRFFELISHGVRLQNFHGPYGRYQNVVCFPSVGDIIFNENEN